MKLQPPKIVSIRLWKDGKSLEEGNELTILETEPGGGGGGILLDLEKKLYFLNILLEYVNMSFIDFSNRSLIYI